MDDTAIQSAKVNFAESQDPPIEACTNLNCKFTGCTCGSKCGCHIKNKNELGQLQQCDPCSEFKRKKKMEKLKEQEGV